MHSQTQSALQGLDSLLDRSGPAVLSAVSQGNTIVHQISPIWYWNNTTDWGSVHFQHSRSAQDGIGITQLTADQFTFNIVDQLKTVLEQHQ